MPLPHALAAISTYEGLTSLRNIIMHTQLDIELRASQDTEEIQNTSATLCITKLFLFIPQDASLWS
jgi:hypothetical protein